MGNRVLASAFSRVLPRLSRARSSPFRRMQRKVVCILRRKHVFLHIPVSMSCPLVFAKHVSERKNCLPLKLPRDPHFQTKSRKKN